MIDSPVIPPESSFLAFLFAFFFPLRFSFFFCCSSCSALRRHLWYASASSENPLLSFVSHFTSTEVYWNVAEINNNLCILQTLSRWINTHTHTHTHPFNGPFSGTTQVSQCQKGKTNLDFTEAETVSGSGISWAICNSAPHSGQITMPVPWPPLSFLQAGCPFCHPTNSVKALKA